MRVIITGDREWTEYTPIYRVLFALHETHPDAIIVHGDCRGADRIAGHIAESLFGKDHVEAWPADWDRHKKAAGPIRNRFMLTESQRRGDKDGHRLEYGVAFHHNLAQSKGTKDMVAVLEKAGIPVLKVG